MRHLVGLLRSRLNVLLKPMKKVLASLLFCVHVCGLTFSSPPPGQTGGKQAQTETAARSRPLSLSQIEDLISNGTPDAVVEHEIKNRGLSFALDATALERLRKLGAGERTIKILETLARATRAALSLPAPLREYSAGEGMIGNGDATFTLDIPDNAGIALFKTANPSKFTLPNRLDAVGSTSEPDTLYKEGKGYPAIMTSLPADYSFYRDMCGNSGRATSVGGCPQGGIPKDTDDNAADLLFVDTQGSFIGAGQRLGAPGPEGLASPVFLNSSGGLPQITSTQVAPCRRFWEMPNSRVEVKPDPKNSFPEAFGALSVYRSFTNTSKFPLRHVRFRVIDITSFPAPEPGLTRARSHRRT